MIMKKVIVVITIVLGILLLCCFVAVNCMKFFEFSSGRFSLFLQPYDSVLDEEIVTAKQVLLYLDEELKKNYLLRPYNWIAEDITMKFSKKHRGSVEVTFILYGANREELKVITAKLDTQKHIFYGFFENGYKLNDATVVLPSFSEWKVDSDEAVTIFEEALRKHEILNYSDVTAFANSAGWQITTVDDVSKYCCKIHIDPYTGEVLALDIP